MSGKGWQWRLIGDRAQLTLDFMWPRLAIGINMLVTSYGDTLLFCMFALGPFYVSLDWCIWKAKVPA